MVQLVVSYMHLTFVVAMDNVISFLAHVQEDVGLEAMSRR